MLLRRVGERDVLQLHAAGDGFKLLRVQCVRRFGRLVDQLEDPCGAGQRVLKLRDHAGDLVEGLGVLVRVAEEARQPADRDRACHGAERAGKADAGINNIVNDARGRVRHGRKERRTHGRRRQTVVDLVKLAQALVLVRESLHDALAAQLLVDQRGLLPARLGLQLEHGIGMPRDELCHQQRKRRQQHDDQRDLPADRKHEAERAHNGQNAGKQLREAHEQAVCELVDIGDHAAERVAGGVAVQICKRQPLQVGKRLTAHVARHAEADAVVDGRHDPLQNCRQTGKHGDSDRQRTDGSKIDLSGADDLVDRVADQNGDIERARCAGRGQQQGCKQQRQIPPEAF